MGQVTFIYALLDPRTDEIRYVGKADVPENRFVEHLTSSFLVARTRKNAWIKGLLREGLKPRLRILEEVDVERWEEREGFWITKLRREGLDLTNMTPGGDGASCPKPAVGEANRRRVWRTSSLKKLSDRMLGDKNPMRDPEIAALMSRRTRGRSNSWMIGNTYGRRTRGRVQPPEEREMRSRSALKRWAVSKEAGDRSSGVYAPKSEEAKLRMSRRAVLSWADPVKKEERIRKGRETRARKKAERLRSKEEA